MRTFGPQSDIPCVSVKVANAATSDIPVLQSVLTLSTKYSSSVSLSVILDTIGRYLSVKAGHAPADYEYFGLNTRCSRV